MGHPGSNEAAAPRRRRALVPILVKVVAALVIPLVAVAALSWMQISQARDEVARVDEETALALVALSPGGVIHALTTEQGDSTLTPLGEEFREATPLPTRNWEESKAETDAALASLRSAVEAGGPVARAAYGPVMQTITDALPDLRPPVDEAAENPGLQHWDMASEVYAGYSPLIADLTQATDDVANAITDNELRAAAMVLADVNRAHDASSKLTRAVGDGLTPADPSSNDAQYAVVARLERFRVARETLLTRTDGPWADDVARYEANENFLQLIERAEEWLDSGEINMNDYIALNPAVTLDGEAEPGSTDAISQTAQQALASRVTFLQDEARAEERRYTLISGGVLVGGILIAALLARSVTRPMMSLTRQADDMASRTLPEAVQTILDTPAGSDLELPEIPEVTVRTKDETGLVASALNDVQRSAVGLAVEQATLRHHIADSFVSMGRRTQNLIGLQLELITELEHEETDPAALDSLYKLDHLATRARRNAESLVVLAGSEPPRSGSAPAAMSDVVRAMLSEVEEYQRVEIVGVDDALVPGNLAADLVHLLSELVENGLSFSPPNKAVEVVGRRTEAGYLVTVVDQGVGMVSEKIEQANRRLAGEDSFTVAPSRYLGHYVAGKLALRVGARVSLRPGREGGLVATVELADSSLIADESAPVAPPSEAPAPEASLTGATLSPGTAPGSEPASGVHVDGRPPALDEAIADSGPRRRRGDRPSPVVSDGAPPTPEPSRAEAAVLEPEVTGSGLRRRVPGQHAQVSDRSPLIKSGGVASAPPGVSSPAETQNLAGLLTAYTSGVERGREELDHDSSSPASNPTEHPS